MPTLISSGETLASRNPANDAVVGSVPVTPIEQIGQIVGDAHRAQRDWEALGLLERIERLRPIGPALVDRAEPLGCLLTEEMGKPLPEAVGEVQHCGEALQSTLDQIADALRPEIVEDERTRSTIHRDAYGVCAAITPWNFPVAMPHWTVIPALAAGNAVVLKPSEQTPLVAQEYADLLCEHLPLDVLQVVHGGDARGRALVEADVDLIAFTGSREAGREILTTAGRGFKRVILELGGKDPLIVLHDADLEKAAAFAVRNSFRNAGQVCVSTERIYVDARVADRFESEVARLTRELSVGSGTDEGVQVGPMISASQRDSVLRQLRDAVDRGARVLAGGSGHRDNFVMPTVLADVDHGMSIMRQETFGPVACIMRFDRDDEAVELANDTPFGLGAVVFGDDEHAASVARRLGAGMIGINRGCGGASGAPWVGARQSGYGYHSGRDGHRQFAQVRVVSTGKPAA